MFLVQGLINVYPVATPSTVSKFRKRGGDVEEPIQIAELSNGKAIYKDHEGNICTLTNDFQYLRSLTLEEEAVYKAQEAPKGSIERINTVNT